MLRKNFQPKSISAKTYKFLVEWKNVLWYIKVLYFYFLLVISVFFTLEKIQHKEVFFWTRQAQLRIWRIFLFIYACYMLNANEWTAVNSRFILIHIIHTHKYKFFFSFMDLSMHKHVLAENLIFENEYR